MSEQFDVFFCHNSKEKAEVEKIREQLKQRGIYAWLDKYDFEPFRRWQDQLEEIIPKIKAAAIFIGSSGIGPWADIEMREFLEEFVRRRIRMGLVILPGCPNEILDTVPRFINSFHRVDFRQSSPDPMNQLIWGITGEKPKLSDIISDNIELKNELGVDYNELRDLLIRKEWKEADKLTQMIMLKTARKEEILLAEDIKIFPCAALMTIDKLWRVNSDDKFGFSVQKQIFESIVLESTDDDKIYIEFAKQVGWYLKDENKWLWLDEIIYDDKNAPKGHLPWRAISAAKIIYPRMMRVGSKLLVSGKKKLLLERNRILFDRINICNNINITEIRL